MTASDLRKWMKANRKTVLQVAVLLNIHSQTVYKFLNGSPVSSVVQAAIDNLVRQQKNAGGPGGPEAA